MLNSHKNILIITNDQMVFDTPNRWTYNGRNALTNMETVITGIPSGWNHQTRTLEFGQVDDWMYLSVGSKDNVDTNSERARVVRTRINLSVTLPIAFTAMELFANGLRNEVGLRIDAKNRLWGVENGVDNLDRFSTNPPLYITNPAEEVNIFPQENSGAHYGYPWCWSEGIGENAQFSFSGGLGNGTVWGMVESNDTWCRTQTKPCSWALQAHAAPLDIFFDSGFVSSGPVAVIPQHGSWNRPADRRAGYRIEYLNLDADYNVLGLSLLVQFVQDGTIRPVAGTKGTCSSYGECLFFTDDGGNQIFAIGRAEVSPASSPHPTPATVPGPTSIPVPTSAPTAAPRALPGHVITIDDELTMSWSIEDGVLSTTAVHTHASGWFSAGWNQQSVMSGVVVLATGGTNTETGTVEITQRDPDLILATWNDPSMNWGYEDLQSSVENNVQTISFKRPIICPPNAHSSCFNISIDGSTETSFIFANHYDSPVILANATMYRHSNTASRRVALYDSATQPTQPPTSGSSHASPYGLLVILILFVVACELL